MEYYKRLCLLTRKWSPDIATRNEVSIWLEWPPLKKLEEAVIVLLTVVT